MNASDLPLVLTTDEVAAVLGWTHSVPTRRNKVRLLVIDGKLTPLLPGTRPIAWRFARAEVLELIGAAPADPDTAPPSTGTPTLRSVRSAS